MPWDSVWALLSWHTRNSPQPSLRLFQQVLYFSHEKRGPLAKITAVLPQPVAFTWTQTVYSAAARRPMEVRPVQTGEGDNRPQGGMQRLSFARLLAAFTGYTEAAKGTV